MARMMARISARAVGWWKSAKWSPKINAYKIVKIIDVVYQPGAGDPVPAPDDKGMDVDMVCHIMAGEFTIQKKGIPAYTVKEGFLYTCGKGKTDQATNISKVVGIHRIALLIPA